MNLGYVPAGRSQPSSFTPLVQILALPGPVALSPSRLLRLNAAIRAGVPQLRIVSAAYVHFVALDGTVDSNARRRLDSVLTYGEFVTARGVAPGVASIMVIPRVGTISPWSSKATDIAQQCGLPMVQRIERATRFLFEGGQLEELAPFIHDRMTETVLPDTDAADAIFRTIAHLRWSGLTYRAPAVLRSRSPISNSA